LPRTCATRSPIRPSMRPGFRCSRTRGVCSTTSATWDLAARTSAPSSKPIGEGAVPEWRSFPAIGPLRCLGPRETIAGPGASGRLGRVLEDPASGVATGAGGRTGRHLAGSGREEQPGKRPALRRDGADEDADQTSGATRITLRPHDPRTGEEIEKREVVEGYRLPGDWHRITKQVGGCRYNHSTSAVNM
jgi:hypothetical protein